MAVVVVVVLVISLFSLLLPGTTAACETGGAAGNIDPKNVPNTAVAGYGYEQLVNAAIIMNAAYDQGLNVREQTIGVMTTMVESTLVNIDYGDWETSGVTNPDGSATTSIGLISLAGEIRAASSAKQRLSEAKRLGFDIVIDADAAHVREALRLAFAGAAEERVQIPEF